MLDRFRQFGINTKSFIYAVVIHLAVAVLLFASFDWGSTPVYPVAQSSQVEPVKATVVSEAEIKKQMDLLKAKEEKKKKEELQAKKRLDDLRKKRQLEKKRLADLKKQKQAEAAKAKKLAKKRKQEEIRLAKLKQEKQRKAKEAAARKQKQEREKREAEERERRQLAEREAQEKAKREAELKAQLEAEEMRKMQSAVADARSRYIPMIQQKVDRNWTRPPGLTGLTAGVRVRLTPGGEVISARVVRSSGNPVFDRSVENAVLKASPLPIPAQRGVNEEFRDIKFNFDPDKNLIS